MSLNPASAEARTTTSLDLAGAWLLNSGIQRPAGGVSRYYLADVGQNRAISTEITGYAISALVFLHARTGNERYLEGASQAGRFLTRIAWDSKLEIFPFESYEKGEASLPARSYFFDCGIIIRGLLRLWRVTRDAELLRIAEACGRSMQKNFAAGGSEYHPILMLPQKDPQPRADQWSRLPGCYQLKAALGWLELDDAIGSTTFLNSYEDLLSASLATHTAFLPGAIGDRVMDRLHAYCYFLEGLLPRLNRPEVAAAMTAGIAAVIEQIGVLGGHFVRSDVHAQLLRVQLLADLAGIVPLDQSAAQRRVETISAFQSERADPRMHGGYFFASRDGELQPHVNPVSTAFAIQALTMWGDYLAGDLPFSP